MRELHIPIFELEQRVMKLENNFEHLKIDNVGKIAE